MTGPTPTPTGSTPVVVPPSAGQTVGPFFHTALPWPGDSTLVEPGRADAVRLRGRVLDGAGAPVPDALVELWQADPAGAPVQEPGSLRRDGWRFTGFGRCATDGAGEYVFSTLAPGPVEAGRVPYVLLTVFARGLLHRLLTRAYLPAAGGDETALAADPLLASLDEQRRATLVAAVEEHGWRFDVHLQGEAETVFLTYPRLARSD